MAFLAILIVAVIASPLPKAQIPIAPVPPPAPVLIPEEVSKLFFNINPFSINEFLSNDVIS